jgi:integrase
MTTTPTTPQRTLADLLTAYTRDYLPLKAPTTQYQEGLLFRWMAAELGSIPLADLTPLVLRTWLDTLKAHYKPNTIRRYRTALSAVLTVGVEQYEWLAKQPLRRVPRLPQPAGRQRCLTPEELQRLLAAYQASKNRCLYVAVRLALCTGLRKNELRQRLWADIDFVRGIISIPQSKNGERRAVPLAPQALALLREHALTYGDGRYVFPQRGGDKPVFVDDAFRMARQRAGIDNFRWHDLRHCCASYLAMSGASLLDIASLLGHKSLTQTLQYTHLATPYTAGVVQRMAEQFLDAPAPAVPAVPAPPVAPVRDVLAIAEQIITDVQAAPPRAASSAEERHILVALQQMAPRLLTAAQVARIVGLPAERARAILQALVRLRRVEQPAKGQYRHRPSSEEDAI